MFFENKESADKMKRAELRSGNFPSAVPLFMDERIHAGQ